MLTSQDSFTEFSLINGQYEYSSEWLGTSEGRFLSMSNDGNFVLFGMGDSDGESNGSIIPFAGKAYVVQKTGNTWSVLGNTINGEFESGRFGASSYGADISSDGKTIAIGASKGPGENGNYVRVSKFNGTEWINKGDVLNYNEGVKGVELEENGDYLVVWTSSEAWYERNPNDEKVFFYKLVNGNWSQFGSVLRFDGIENIDFKKGTLIVHDRSASNDEHIFYVKKIY